MNNFIKKYFTPSSNDKQYSYDDNFMVSLILRADSYKFAHAFSYRPGIKGMHCYGEARVGNEVITVPAGMQMLLKRYFTRRITMAHIDEAERFALAHFGRSLFSRKDWEKVVMNYNGFAPLIIRSAEEGTKVPGGNALYTVTVLDEDLFWMAAYFETIILRGVWYPTTIATMDYSIMQDIVDYYKQTGADMGMLPFALHDFGGRGVTCAEQAEIGGMAHLFNFQGSDTVEGILAANHFYKVQMAAFSVAATEHSVECSFGLDEEGEEAYLEHFLTKVAARGSIGSIVIDGRDTMRCAARLCSPKFVKLIQDSGCKVVFRPDSGDMMVIVPALLEMQEKAFGFDYTSTGHKKIRSVGIIQGDGVDHGAIRTLLGKIMILGYSADCVLFGSGGALLQKVNRDTLKFAQKASSILIETTVDSEEYDMGDVKALRWIGIAKDPITDPGKKSKIGVLTLVRDTLDGQVKTVRIDEGDLPETMVDLHKIVYHYGDLYNEITMDEVRTNLKAA
jgi:nicotinamide phosphoribosyltransferase